MKSSFNRITHGIGDRVGRASAVIMGKIAHDIPHAAKAVWSLARDNVSAYMECGAKSLQKPVNVLQRVSTQAFAPDLRDAPGLSGP